MPGVVQVLLTNAGRCPGVIRERRELSVNAGIPTEELVGSFQTPGVVNNGRCPGVARKRRVLFRCCSQIPGVVGKRQALFTGNAGVVQPSFLRFGPAKI